MAMTETTHEREGGCSNSPVSEVKAAAKEPIEGVAGVRPRPRAATRRTPTGAEAHSRWRVSPHRLRTAAQVDKRATGPTTGKDLAVARRTLTMPESSSKENSSYSRKMTTPRREASWTVNRM